MIVSHVGGCMTKGNTDCTEKLFFPKYYSSYLAFPASGNIKLLFREAGIFWIAILQGYCSSLSDTTKYVLQSFISPTNAQLICFKILKFTLKRTILLNAATCFGLTKPSLGCLQSVLR